MFWALMSRILTVAFAPSGMTKNGTQAWATSATWVRITSFDPNTATYPGSSVTSDGLNVQGIKLSAALSARAPYTGGQFVRPHTIRLVDQTGAVIGTQGSTVTADSGTCTVDVSGVNLTSITRVHVEMNSNGASAGTITSGATCYCTII